MLTAARWPIRMPQDEEPACRSPWLPLQDVSVVKWNDTFRREKWEKVSCRSRKADISYGAARRREGESLCRSCSIETCCVGDRKSQRLPLGMIHIPLQTISRNCYFHCRSSEASLFFSRCHPHDSYAHDHDPSNFHAHDHSHYHAHDNSHYNDHSHHNCCRCYGVVEEIDWWFERDGHRRRSCSDVNSRIGKERSCGWSRGVKLDWSCIHHKFGNECVLQHHVHNASGSHR